jgi:hypothetical protein
MKNLDKFLISLISIFIAVGVALNIREQYSIDKSKLPSKLEANSKFQSWLSNLEDKGLDLEADKFEYVEENDVFNTVNLSTDSIDNENSRKNYEANMTELLKFKESAVSPNEREIVNFTNSDRFGFFQNEVFFYGLREDRILRIKLADCAGVEVCNFHRASFLDNHVFFIIELSLKDRQLASTNPCTLDQVCEYTFKAHLVDLNNNSRTVYESETVNDTFLNIKKKL